MKNEDLGESSLINKIFKMKITKSSLNLPPSIMSHAIIVDNRLFNKFNDSSIIEKFSLNINARYNFLLSLTNEWNLIHFSPENNYSIGILVLQSFSALLLSDICSLDSTIINTYLSSLRKSIPLITDETLFIYSFYLVFRKLCNYSNAFNLLNNINEIIDEYTPKLVNFKFIHYFFDDHVAFIIHILDLCWNNQNERNFILVSKHINIIMKLFSCFPKIDEIDLPLIQKLYEQTARIPVDFINEEETNIFVSSFKFCLDIWHLSSIKFEYSMPIIFQFVINPSIINIKYNEKQTNQVEIIQSELNKKEAKGNFRFPSVTDLLEILFNINHPIVSILTFTKSLSCSAILLLVHSFINDDIMKNELIDPNIVILSLLLLKLISKEAKSLSEIIDPKKHINVFFHPAIFNPEVTIFNQPNSPLISIRYLTFQILFLFVNDPCVPSLLCLFFMQNKQNYEICAESFHYIIPMFEFLEIQYSMTLFDFLAQEIKLLITESNQFLLSILIDIINELVERSSTALLICRSASLCITIFSLLHNTELINMILSILQKLFRISFNEITLINDSPLYIVTKENLNSSPIYNILLPMLYNILLEKKFPEKKYFFLSSTFKELLLNFNADDEEKCLIFLDFIRIYHQPTYLWYGEIDWKSINDKLLKFGITRNIYHKLLLIISNSQKYLSNSLDDDYFPGISSIEQKDIVYTVLASDFKFDFLHKMLSITNSSPVQCFICYQIDLPLVLLDYYQNSTNNSEMPIFLQLFINISLCICNRQNVFKYLRMLNPINGSKQNPKSSLLFKALKTLTVPTTDEITPIIQFNDISHFISIPSFSMNDFPNGIFLATHILIEPLIQKNDFIKLFSLKNNEISINCTVYSNRIEIESSLFVAPLVLYSVIPTNKWISFALKIYTFGNIELFIDGIFSGSMHIECSNVPSNCVFEKLIMFHGHCKAVQFTGVVIYPLPIPDNIPLVISNTTLDSLDCLLNNSPRYLFSTKWMQNSRLINFASHHDEGAIYFGTNFPFAHSFYKVFEASKGISFIISLFSQIDLPCETSNLKYIDDLLSCTFSILSNSQPMQNEVMIHDGFAVPAYFLITSNERNITQSLWSQIYHSLPMISHEELYINCLKYMIFNSELWYRAPKELLLEILSGWDKLISDNNTYIIANSISMPTILEIMHVLIISNRLEDLLIKHIITIMVNLIQKLGLNENDLKLIIQIIELDSIESDVIIILFQMLLSFENNKKLIAKSLLQSKLIFITKDPNIIIYFIQYFLSTDSELMDQFLFFFYRSLNYYNDEYNKSLIKKIIDMVNKKSFLNIFISPLLMIIFYYSHNHKSNFDEIDFAKNSLVKLFSSDSSYKFISSETSIFVCFLISLYIMMIQKNLQNLFGKYLSENLQIIDKFLYCFDIISIITNYTLIDDMNNILISAISNILLLNDKLLIQKIISIFSNSLFNCIKSNVFQQNKIYSKIDDLTILIEYYRSIVSKPTIGIHLNPSNGTWIYIKTILFLIQSVIPYCSKYVEDYFHFYILIYYASIFNSKEIISLVSIFSESIELNLDWISPLLIKNMVILDKINIKLPNQIIENDYNIVLQAQSILDIFYSGLTIRHYFTLHLKPISFSNFSQFKRRNHQSELRRTWRHLWQSISHDRSPYIEYSIIHQDHHFKRGNQFDFKFRPILLVRNNKFNNHYEASMLRGSMTKEESDKIFQENSKRLSSHFIFSLDEKESKQIPSIPYNIYGNLSDNHISEKSNGIFYDSSIIYKINDEIAYNSSHIIWCSECEYIKIMETIKGAIYVTHHEYFFTSDNKNLRISGNSIQYVFWCWHDQKPDSIQIFTTEHKGYLIRFPHQESHAFIFNLKKVHMPNIVFFQENPPQEEIENLKLTTKWKNHQISTFEYLTWLNLLSGRSYFDSRKYPIFPIIIKNYESNEIDFSNLDLFRDLNHNVAHMNPNALEKLKEKQSLIGENFLFNSCYSNFMAITYYLLRMEPFTSLHIKLQDGRFDAPMRMFTSIKDNFEKIYGQSASIREYTPEFYFCSEFSMNTNKFNFGITEDGNQINDLILPSWANDSPVKFIQVQQNALESEYVSNHISSWIDLIWGYKQFSSDDDNTFDPKIYPNVWKTKFAEECPETVQDFLNCIGQIPQKLFSSPHVKRKKEPKLRSHNQVVILQNIPSPVVSFKCLGSVYEKMKVIAILNNGSIFCLRFAASNFEISKQHSILFKRFPSNGNRIAFFDKNPSFAYASEGSSQLRIFDFQKRKVIVSQNSPHLAAISCLDVSNDLILTGGDDSCVTLWHYTENTYINSISSLDKINTLPNLTPPPSPSSFNYDSSSISNSNNNIIEQNPNYANNCISEENNNIHNINNDCKKNNQISIVNTLMAHRDAVTCCLISDEYNIVVTCSKDNSMIISKLSDLSLLRVVDLNFENDVYPIHVIITKVMGYILVFAEGKGHHFVVNYTINGRFINKHDFGSEIHQAISVSKRDVIDYFAILNRENQILLYDAFSLNKISLVWKSSKKITLFRYHEQLNDFVVTTSDMHVLFVPVNFP
ncbi:hypothetical protein TRFO_21177 [Tritrichomonas foetus]|uniref:BEACH domain-containing protein n=1 Tax=Tritrichomonas foetus TaxID=1144522 RepID=A0A1J4KIV5_9EUKA|nr:hypothetical protein TRFO_21177 [Tritrichomonas foetus]|eukprot:OHT09756.1 hypothetical protein TRFO_21177 [Tritrichomonas foetus]